MREIKFRAWHKLSNQMYYGGELDGFDTLDSYIQHEDELYIGMGGETVLMNSDRTYEVHNDEFELMQYTGLKDKNGKEIYEGDILRQFPEGEPNKELYPELLIVEWHQAGFILDPSNSDTLDKWRIIMNWSKMEIVGNIYENPELIS